MASAIGVNKTDGTLRKHWLEVASFDLDPHTSNLRCKIAH